MYPRSWFDTYWRGTLKPEVFVAMPFANEFDLVWENAIRPAIENDLEGGGKYKAHRVDVTRFSELLAGALAARTYKKSQMTKHTWSLLDRDCLNLMLRQGDHKPFGEKDASITELLTIRRLLELGIIRCEKTGDYSYIYVWTDFGIAVTKNPNSPAT